MPSVYAEAYIEIQFRAHEAMSAFVQVFGCRHDEAIHAVRRNEIAGSGAPAVPRALMEI